MTNNDCCKLHPVCFGLALGILGGLWMFVVGILASHYYLSAIELVKMLSTFYVGFEGTVRGSLIGAGEGFVYHFVTGFIFALLYNLLASVCMKYCSHKKRNS